MLRRHSFLTAGAVLLLWASTTPSNADLIIGVGDLDLMPGGTGSVTVSISSTTGTDLLDMFGDEFRITTAGSTRLEFVNPQSDSQLTNSSYVLPLANSADASVLPLHNALVKTVSANNDTYIGGDGTLNGLGVTVTTPPELLVKLDVTANTTNAPIAGNTFTISLVSSTNTTFLQPASGNFASIAATSTPGTVRIAAIPEPSTVVMLLGLAAFIGLIGRKRLHRKES